MILYRQPRQAADRDPTAWEEQLADVLEGAFGQGIHELDGIVEQLNQSRVKPPNGGQWDAARFQDVIKELGR
jgi:hypothetical protein